VKSPGSKQIFLLLLVFILTILPVTAFASETSVLTIPAVNDDVCAELGTVFTRNSGLQLSGGDKGVISLPDDFKFLRSMNVNDEMNSETVTVDGAVYSVDDWNTKTIDGTTWIHVPEKGYFQEGTEPFLTTDSAPDYYPTAIHLFNPLMGGQTITESIKVGKPDANYFEFPVQYGGEASALYIDMGGGNYMLRTGIHVEKLKDNEIEIEIIGDVNGYGFFHDPDPGLESFMYVHNGAVYVDEGHEGTIFVNVDAPSDSGISTGDIPIGTVGSGEVNAEIVDAPTFNDTGKAKIRIKEKVNDALKDESESLKFTLPDSFEWGAVQSVDVIWGKAKADVDGTTTTGITGGELEALLAGAFECQEDELILNLNSVKVDYDGDSTDETITGFESTEETCFEFEVLIEVMDETEAEYGDVEVSLTGSDSDVSPESLVMGYYGDFNVTIEADDGKVTTFAGYDGQAVSDITIKEILEGSLVDGRTVTLTLPENAAWDTFDNKDIEGIADGAAIVSDSGVELDFAGLIGDDDETLKLIVDTAGSSDEAELTLEDIEVALEAGEAGDLVVEVGGSAGLEGEITVAEVVAPIAATAETTTVKIGLMDQAAGDIVIAETKAGAIEESKTLTVTLPDDVEFDGTPDVEVTEGDLTIDDYEIDDDKDNVLKIDIDNDSDEASTITISGIKYLIDRTLPEGDIEVEIGGPAVVETHATGLDWDGDGNVDEDEIFFEDSDVAVEVVNAVCGTPAPDDQKLTTSVTLGENGSYISDDRIMVQLRDAATALGVSEQNLFWDNATKTATFIKGDRAVQITVGKSRVVMNGTPLSTDKGAEIKDGRTYVSLRAAGVAFGAATAWDNSAKTATLTVE